MCECKKMTNIIRYADTDSNENAQASDSGVGSHSPSPDLASDGEEAPRNKRFACT